MGDNITIKVRLKDICDGNVFDTISNTVNDINEVLEIAYPLMRSFILAVIEQKPINDKVLSIPVIDEKFVYAFLGISAYGPLRIRNKASKEDLIHYYHYFVEQSEITPKILTNVTYILNQCLDDIYTSMIVNIKCHFEKYIWKFIRCSFNKKYEKAQQNKTLKKCLKKLTNIKDYLLSQDNSKIKLSSKRLKWIEKYKDFVLPQSYTYMKFETDIVEHTFEYLKCMHYVSKYLQSYGVKSLQFFPLKKSVTRSHITINTNALIEIFGKKVPLNDEIKHEKWSKYFNLNNYNRKGYSFNHQISTNGYCVSLNFVKNTNIEKQVQKKLNFKMSHAENKEAKGKMNKEEYKVWHDDKMKKTKEKNEKFKLDKKVKKEAFKKTVKKPVTKKEISEFNNRSEFPYIDKMEHISQEFKDKFDQGKIVVCDPGKRSILYMMSSNKVNVNTNQSCNNFGVTTYKNKKIMNYTNGTRSALTQNKKYTKKRERWKDEATGNEEWEDKTFKDIEQELSLLNSKSCNHHQFMKYVFTRFDLIEKVKEQYDIEKLEQMKWYSYINMVRHEKELVKHIKSEFGEDVELVIGDWSKGNCIRYKSTPNIGLKRKLAEHFKVYQIDEFRTSIMHNIHGEKCEHLVVPLTKKDKEKIEKRKLKYEQLTKVKKKTKKKPIVQPDRENKELHAVLTYKNVIDKMTSKSLSGCINRDKNSVLNMIKIVSHLITHGERPDLFKRGQISESPKVKIL